MDSAPAIKEELHELRLNEIKNAPEVFEKEIEEILREFKTRNKLNKRLNITLLLCILFVSSTLIYQLVLQINNNEDNKSDKDHWSLGFLTFFFLTFFFLEREEEKLELSTLQKMRSCLKTTCNLLFPAKDDPDQAHLTVQFEKQIAKRTKKDSFKKLAIVFMKYVPNAIPETLEIFGLNKFPLTTPYTENTSKNNTEIKENTTEEQHVKTYLEFKINNFMVALIGFSNFIVFYEILIKCLIEPFEVHPLQKIADELVKSFIKRLKMRELKNK
jgi:hypothetical protein